METNNLLQSAILAIQVCSYCIVLLTSTPNKANNIFIVVRTAGKTLVPLEGDASISRVNETNLGNYVCDAFLRSVPQAVAAKAAGGKVTICLMNAGGIRSGFKVNAEPVLMCNTAHITVLLLCSVPHTVQCSEVSNVAVQQGTGHWSVQYVSVQYLINAMRTRQSCNTGAESQDLTPPGAFNPPLPVCKHIKWCTCPCSADI